MKTGMLSILMFAVLGVGIVRSGSYGQSRAQTPKGSSASQPQIELLGETAEVRRVRHALGECRLPRRPQRIVSLSAVATDTLVALGIRPLMVESAWKSAAPAAYLADGLKGTVAVRRAGGINIEAVLDMEPELILISSVQDGRLYGQLNKIAPTVPLRSLAAGSLEATVLDMGTVLDMPERAKQRLEEYRRRIAQAKILLATAPATSLSRSSVSARTRASSMRRRSCSGRSCSTNSP